MISGSAFVYWSGCTFVGAILGGMVGLATIGKPYQKWVPDKFYGWFVAAHFLGFILLTGFILLPFFANAFGLADAFIDWSR